MVKLLSLLCLSTLAVSTYATWVHVNKGCILVSGSPICAGTIGGGNQINISNGKATIYARYNGNDKNDKAYPGCKLSAKWSENYGDIYYGTDDCLHASSNSGNYVISCCDAQSGLQKTINPYRGT